MKSLILSSVVVAAGMMMLLKPMTAKDAETKTQKATTIRYEICPVVGDTRPSTTASSQDIAPYDHCSHCNTGVFLAHNGEDIRKCTFCGKSE